jgi:UDP-N-acetylglucosamine--dolichyl-phosphate N-acetylglucosaminephosphotransferase
MTKALSAVTAAAGVALVFNPGGTLFVSSLGFASIGFAATNELIPKLGPLFQKIGLKGRDRAKDNPTEIPESMGAVAASVYLFCMFFFIPFMFYKFLVTSTSGGGNREEGVEVGGTELEGHLFPHNKLAGYLSALLCLQSMLVLGMADDLFDIRWRNKFFLPAISAIPLLVVYYVDFGVTHVVLPPFLRLGQYVDLGPWYYVYMAAVAIFCPNCINIYAGVNGLEVGQALVMALCVLLNDLLYLVFLPGHPAEDSHLFSACFLLPLIGVSAALLQHNWYPARVFVGDTYCYFAGMVFAVVGILGHFSKTMMLFFAPQIFNFLYSAPQLFKLVECPRHRMPNFNVKTGLLEPSRASLAKSHPMVVKVLRILGKLGLIGFYDGEKGPEISNMTLINLVLVRLGSVREDRLTMSLLTIQLCCGILAIIGRHTAAAIIFGRDNM